MTASAGRSAGISLDTLLALVVLSVPVGLFAFIPDDPRFTDATTVFITLLMSVVLIAALRLNRALCIPVLSVFLLNYVLFWHLRYLTLTLMPEFELALTRTVTIDVQTFNAYSWVVLASTCAALAGIFMGHAVVSRGAPPRAADRKTSTAFVDEVARALPWIACYLIAAAAFRMLSFFVFDRKEPQHLRLFFSSDLVLFLLLLVLSAPLTRAAKLFFWAYMVAFVLLALATGVRSTIVQLLIFACVVQFIREQPVVFRLKHFAAGIVLGLALVLTFTFATYQRQVRGNAGLTAGTLQQAVDYTSRIQTFDTLKPFLGLAAARAGYLDYSAEIYANERYAEVVNIIDEVKSTIDNYIPGQVFHDGRRISYKLRDIYYGPGLGRFYQSDALGAVGENYRLFGYAFPIVIAGVAMLLTILFSLPSPTIWRYYFKFIVALTVMSWWNSYGYDWLLMEFGRQMIFGGAIVWAIFYAVRPAKRKAGRPAAQPAR